MFGKTHVLTNQILEIIESFLPARHMQKQTGQWEASILSTCEYINHSQRYFPKFQKVWQVQKLMLQFEQFRTVSRSGYCPVCNETLYHNTSQKLFNSSLYYKTHCCGRCVHVGCHYAYSRCPTCINMAMASVDK
jgi:hypothetical protein